MKPKGEWLRNLCMIYSGGGNGAYGKELKSGLGFSFGRGETIKISFEKNSREVRFENSQGQVCTSTVDELKSSSDNYYGYVALQEGSRIQIVE